MSEFVEKKLRSAKAFRIYLLVLAFRCFARVNFAFCQTHLDFENISHTDMMLFCRHLNSGNKFAQNWHSFAGDKGMRI